MSRHALAFVCLYAGLALAMFLLNGWHAYNPTDDGFIFAYSWRIVSGEVPYRDFIYVRTPLTPYLHAAWLALPDGWAIPAGRLAFYVELAAGAAIPTVWLVARLGLRATPIALGLATMTFLFAVRSFPPMPWPTADGIFFASAGATAFLISLDRSTTWLRWRAVASVLAGLSVLAKQAFAPLLVLLMAWAVVESVKTRSVRGFVASVLPAGLLLGGTLAILTAQGALGAFSQQILSTASLRPSGVAPLGGDPVSIGLLPYLRSLEPFPVALALVVFGLVYWRDSAGPLAGTLRPVGIVVLLAAFAVFGLEQIQIAYWDAGHRVFWLLLAAGAAHALRVVRGHADQLALGAYTAIIAVAWCASLSFAAQSPILALAVAGPLLAFSLPASSATEERAALAVALVFVVRGVLMLNLVYPYRDVARVEQVADLGEVYPRFGTLYSSRTTAQRFRELRQLSERYALSVGRPFLVMPDYPLIYYLARQRSPLSLDWLQPQEFLGNEARLLRELVTRKPVVLLEREPSSVYGQAQRAPPPCGSPPHPPSALISEVTRRWTLVAEGFFFCVYRSPA